MFRPAPHVIPYQGSKRKLAPKILSYIPKESKCLYEPFAGSAAIALASAANGKAEKFVIADKFEPLTNLWSMIIDQPFRLAEEYSLLWKEQLADPAEFYKLVRDRFNKNKTPSDLLYLIARCVKNSIRFNSFGEFNQGADNRRLGMKPEKLMKEILHTSKLLKGKTIVRHGDFREVLHSATKNDVIYMDPPWQGTSGKKDPRYAFLLNIDELITELDALNVREIPYILSFDGACGDKNYGQELPVHLKLQKVTLKAGRSTQATLLGRNEETIESLYLSPTLVSKINVDQIDKHPSMIQSSLSLSL